MGKVSILVSGVAAAHVEPAIHDALGAASYQIVAFETASPQELDTVDVAFISRDITGLSTKYVLTQESLRFNNILRTAANLKWVHTHSAGLDRPIIGELLARGIEVTASSGANAEIVAHSALGGVLSLARNFPHFMKAQRRKEWAPLLGGQLPRDLNGQTAVVVGWGPIGQHLARLLGMLGLEIIVVRNSTLPVAEAKATVSYDNIKNVLGKADWLVLACPLSERTSRLIDGDALSGLPVGACLINVARGEVVVERDLIDALQAGQLAGAFLDVFEHEPLGSESPLWELNNVMVTPHAAGHSAGNYARVIDLFINKLKVWHDRDASGRI